jgi:hypothetical protein
MKNRVVSISMAFVMVFNVTVARAGAGADDIRDAQEHPLPPDPPNYLSLAFHEGDQLSEDDLPDHMARVVTHTNHFSEFDEVYLREVRYNYEIPGRKYFSGHPTMRCMFKENGQRLYSMHGDVEGGEGVMEKGEFSFRPIQPDPNDGIRLVNSQQPVANFVEATADGIRRSIKPTLSLVDVCKRLILLAPEYAKRPVVARITSLGLAAGTH